MRAKLIFLQTKSFKRNVTRKKKWIKRQMCDKWYEINEKLRHFYTISVFFRSLDIHSYVNDRFLLGKKSKQQQWQQQKQQPY